MKNFRDELYKIHNLFLEGPPFAFCKFGDGEWSVINGEVLNNNEFEATTTTPTQYRNQLLAALQYKNPNYYIGICCNCCNGDRARKMYDKCEQDDDHVTFANVFVNSNYNTYQELFFPEFEKRDIHLVANQDSTVNNLPFDIEQFYPVGFSAWVNNHDLIYRIREKKLRGKLFLFACGPFGNLLTHQLFASNPHNIYLDIGSTLNPWLGTEGFPRDYYSNGNIFRGRTCIWDVTS